MKLKEERNGRVRKKNLIKIEIRTDKSVTKLKKKKISRIKGEERKTRERNAGNV